MRAMELGGVLALGIGNVLLRDDGVGIRVLQSLERAFEGDTRRCDFTLSISYADDIDQAMEVARREVASDARAMGDPEPTIAVANLGESSVDLTVRVWLKAEDYWTFKWDMTKRFKQAFDAAGITIPFPQRHIVMQQHPAGKAAAE